MFDLNDIAVEKISKTIGTCYPYDEFSTIINLIKEYEGRFSDLEFREKMKLITPKLKNSFRIKCQSKDTLEQYHENMNKHIELEIKKAEREINSEYKNKLKWYTNQIKRLDNEIDLLNDLIKFMPNSLEESSTVFGLHIAGQPLPSFSPLGCECPDHNNHPCP